MKLIQFMIAINDTYFFMVLDDNAMKPDMSLNELQKIFANYSAKNLV